MPVKSSPAVDAVDAVDAPAISFTEEQIAEQKALLERGIALGVEWFEEGRDAEAFAGMTLKEQKLTRVLDPLVWIMRESLISYQERSEGCEECTLRVETGQNGLALAVAEMLTSKESLEPESGDV